MAFGQTEMILLAAFSVLWWLFYFAIKMRADQKFFKSDQKEDMRPCMGCIVTQSAMAAAATLAIFYGAYAGGFIGISR